MSAENTVHHYPHLSLRIEPHLLHANACERRWKENFYRNLSSISQVMRLQSLFKNTLRIGNAQKIVSAPLRRLSMILKYSNLFRILLRRSLKCLLHLQWSQRSESLRYTFLFASLWEMVTAFSVDFSSSTSLSWRMNQQSAWKSTLGSPFTSCEKRVDAIINWYFLLPFAKRW